MSENEHKSCWKWGKAHKETTKNVGRARPTGYGTGHNLMGGTVEFWSCPFQLCTFNQGLSGTPLMGIWRG